MNKLPSGKAEFERLEQTHISLDDRTANINTVTSAVQSKWGANYIVVTGDGLGSMTVQAPKVTLHVHYFLQSPSCCYV